MRPRQEGFPRCGLASEASAHNSSAQLNELAGVGEAGLDSGGVLGPVSPHGRLPNGRAATVEILEAVPYAGS